MNIPANCSQALHGWREAWRSYGWIIQAMAVVLTIATTAVSLLVVFPLVGVRVHSANVQKTVIERIELPAAPAERFQFIQSFCPISKGWKQTDGIVPPEAPKDAHTAGSNFYVCARHGYEITVWQSGEVSGYDPQGRQLTQEEIRQELNQ